MKKKTATLLAHVLLLERERREGKSRLILTQWYMCILCVLCVM